MAGICPVCVRFEPEAERCSVCGGGLVSPEEWECRKAQALAAKGPAVFQPPSQPSPPVSPQPAPYRAQPPRPNEEPGGEAHGFQMAMGCMTGIAVFILVFFLAYLTYHHAG